MGFIKRLLWLALILVIVYFGLGLIEWNGHSGLWHLDRTLKTTVFTDSWEFITGKAERGWEKTSEKVLDMYGSGKKKIKENEEKIRDQINDLDRQKLDELIKKKMKK